MTSPSSLERIRTSIDRANGFLRRQLHAGHYSLDCHGEEGEERFSHNKGHLFVSYFLADALKGTLDEIDRTILLTRILSEERSGHWGFSPGDLSFSAEQETFIVDADDTCYVLRTLRGLGAYRLPDSLGSYWLDLAEGRGAFVTFRAKGVLANEARVAVEPSFAGNLAVHPEVVLNVFSMLRGTNLERLICWPVVEGFQHAEGWWHSYFYPGPFFGTVLAAEFLHGEPYYIPHLARTKEYLRASQRESGAWGKGDDPYATALALRALSLLDPAAEEIGRGAAFLLGEQSASGGWSSDAVIWRFVGASNEEWLAQDRQGTLVTSLVVTALRRLLV
jgi:hypothetical protein